VDQFKKMMMERKPHLLQEVEEWSKKALKIGLGRPLTIIILVKNWKLSILILAKLLYPDVVKNSYNAVSRGIFTVLIGLIFKGNVTIVNILLT
jgi:hypothetical protein